MTASPLGAQEVTLLWTNSTGASSYTVEYGTYTGVYSTTVSSSASSGINAGSSGGFAVDPFGNILVIAA